MKPGTDHVFGAPKTWSVPGFRAAPSPTKWERVGVRKRQFTIFALFSNASRWDDGTA